MIRWEEARREIKETRAEKERVKSILHMLQEERMVLATLDKEKFKSFSTVLYYDVIKSAIIALMSLSGNNTADESALSAYLQHFYPEFSADEIELADEVIRTGKRADYEGFSLAASFFKENGTKMEKLAEKLIELVKAELSLN
jgi:hypothetical protein